MKKMDEFERFVIRERELFDINNPDKKIWKKISGQLHPGFAPMPWYNSNIIRTVAAIFFLFFLGGFVGYFIGKEKDTSLWHVEKGTMTFTDFELISQKNIRKKIYQLKSLKAEESIFSDLEQMDKAMEELKKDLEGIPVGQEKIVLEQLKRGYQIKIEMLNRIILRLETKKLTQDEKTM
jgi:hypothetical protein